MGNVLEIEDLRVRFEKQTDARFAVDGVFLAVGEGEILALVGESGSGKSVTALSILRLLPQKAVVSAGAIRLLGRDVLKLSSAEIRAVRGRDAAMIFQDPGASLNPVLAVGRQVAAVIRLHHHVSGREARDRARELIYRVGIGDPEMRFRAFPHELSGGMQQRVMISMAIASKPRLLIADEPTSALDMTIQAQILELLENLRRELGMAILLITHDFAVVNEIADRVAVMRGGTIVEEGLRKTILSAPQHPYTQTLLRSIPSGPRRDERPA